MMYYRKLENKQSDEWIVLLHGLCGNTAMWAQQIFTFNKHYNILLLDLPGHGNSTNAVIENNIKDMSDVARVIIDIMDENNIIMGGEPKKITEEKVINGLKFIAEHREIEQDKLNEVNE